MPSPKLAGYTTANAKEQGGDKWNVAGEISIAPGGKITNDGTQALAIADLAAITGGEAPTEAEHNAVRTTVNSILAALRGAGIIAAS